MFYFDPLYFLFLGPAIILAVWAQFRTKAAYAQASQVRSASGLSGAEAAARILRSRGISNVQIQPAQGFLSDHYDPKHKVLRLSEDVYAGRSVASLGIAAHEAGHAIQDAQGYAPLRLRNGIVPLAAIGSNFSWLLLALGFGMHAMNLVMWGIVLFSTVVLFQLINLPVEYDASSRAKAILMQNGLVSPDEQRLVSKVLSAAALTYVAATITSLLTLIYYLFRSGLIGGSSRDE